MNYAVGDNGTVLASRPTGRIVREKIERALQKLPEGTALRVDLSGVIAMSPSCADELFGRLYSALQDGDYGKRLIVLDGLTSDHEQILEPIFKRRGIVAPRTRGRSIRLVAAPEHLNDTYTLARRLGHFTAADIASRLGLTVPAVDNRLAKLWRSRLLNRELAAAKHGGREYVYSSSVR